MPTWPVNLPYQPEMDEFRVEQFTRPALWTEFEDGPPLARRSGAGRRARLTYKIVLPEAHQLAVFRQFFENDLVDGSARFQMPVWIPETQTYQTRTVMIDRADAKSETFGLGHAITFTLLVFNW